MWPSSDHEAGAETAHSRSQRGVAYFEAALPRADNTAMHSSGSGDRDATEAQEKTTRQIAEWFSEQRDSRNQQ